ASGAWTTSTSRGAGGAGPAVPARWRHVSGPFVAHAVVLGGLVVDLRRRDRHLGGHVRQLRRPLSLLRRGRLADDLARVEVDICRIRHRDHPDLARLALELLRGAEALVGLLEALALLGQPLRLAL